MKASEIKELIELVSRSEFSKFELERDGFKLKLVRGAGGEVRVATVAPAAGTEPPASLEAPSPAAAAPAEELHVVASPIVGTYYASPSPDAPPFVAVGDRVSQGQVLCIVEAMKVMNEIEADADGELVEIAADNGQPVEFGDALFKIRTA